VCRSFLTFSGFLPNLDIAMTMAEQVCGRIQELFDMPLPSLESKVGRNGGPFCFVLEELDTEQNTREVFSFSKGVNTLAVPFAI
jgi:hypothetical protein